MRKNNSKKTDKQNRRQQRKREKLEKLFYNNEDENKKPSRRQQRRMKRFEDASRLNVWNGNGFAMCGLGEKSRMLAKIKHFFRCIKWSKQRATRGFADSDVWSMQGYIQELMPAMLKHLKDNRMGSPARLGENCHEEWDKILDRMIFLWNELDEDTCSKKNPYEEAHTKAFSEFSKKYGFLGQGLETEEEKEKNKKTGGHYVHFMREVPEYAEIDRLYDEEERKLEKYREDCKNEVFDLMKEYFWVLWD